MVIQIGSILKNRYRVDTLLGRGGMAEVYKVFDLQRGVPLAMKVLREDLAEDKVFLRRFQREARNLSKLQHPNIVRFYGLEQEGSLAFIIMDYIQGLTLRRIIFDAPEPLHNEKVLEIMQPICSALHYAHQQGIVHCDLKSANIMLDKNGKVYLTDFGIARMADAATSTMVGIGTPAYMAPELIQGQDPTPQTDIYAIGILLFEMYTGGERPFTGEHANTTGTTAEKVRWEHLNQQPPSLLEVNPKASTAINEVIQKCLAKEPGERYQDSLQLLRSVENANKTPGSGKRKKGKTEILESASEGIKEEKASDEINEKEKPLNKKGNKTTKVLLAFFILISLLFGFIIYQLVKDDYQIAIVKKKEVTQEATIEENAGELTAEEPTAVEGQVEEMLGITQTPEEEACTNEAELVSETYKDGYILEPGTPFTKTWVVKNTGTCTWTKDYKVVFESGSQMYGPEFIEFSEAVEPGSETDISVDLVSPNEKFIVRGYWQIQTDDGTNFYNLFIIIDASNHTPDFSEPYFP